MVAGGEPADHVRISFAGEAKFWKVMGGKLALKGEIVNGNDAPYTGGAILQID